MGRTLPCLAIGRGGAFDGRCQVVENTAVATANREITLIIPFSIAVASVSEFSGLGKIVTRGNSRSITPAAPEFLIAEVFGLDTPPGHDIPVGAVSRLADTGDRDNKWWIRADPVYLAPAGDRLVLAADRIDDLTAAQSEHLARASAARLAQEGWLLEAPVPQRWYLSAEPGLRLRTFSPAQARGRHIDPWLPRGEDAQRWLVLLTELQMLFYDMDTNREREAEGRTTVNSLWLWGGGRMPQVPRGSWTGVWSADPFVRGLGALGEVSVGDVPATAGEWDERAGGPGRHLVTLPSGGQPGSAVETLERDWLLELTRELRAGKLDAVTLVVIEDGQEYRLERRHVNRWWNRWLGNKRH